MNISFKLKMEFDNLMNSYIEHVKREELIIVFQKCCGFKLLRSYNKLITIKDVIKDINAWWGNFLNIKLYYIIDNVKIYLNQDNETEMKRVCLQNLVPLYPVPYPVCYGLYIDYGFECNCNNSNYDNNCR
jgi:hypothetical protein